MWYIYFIKRTTNWRKSNCIRKWYAIVLIKLQRTNRCIVIMSDGTLYNIDVDEIRTGFPLTNVYTMPVYPVIVPQPCDIGIRMQSLIAKVRPRTPIIFLPWITFNYIVFPLKTWTWIYYEKILGFMGDIDEFGMCGNFGNLKTCCGMASHRISLFSKISLPWTSPTWHVCLCDTHLSITSSHLSVNPSCYHMSYVL